MWIRASAAALALALAGGVPAPAQAPLSAIDWLSDSVRRKPGRQTPPETAPPQVPAPAPAAPAIEEEEPPATPAEALADPGGNGPGEAAAPEGIVDSVIEVTPLDRIRKDTVGLLPTSITGLPVDLWGESEVGRIIALLTAQPDDALPELLSLLQTLLLAEVNPPRGSSDATLLLARTDKLLELGALDQAQALLERAGPDQIEIFRRWFDVSLLSGREDYACTAMRAAPGFAPTLQARIFCLARGGDWSAAALTLATGETLGFLDRDQADLLARFLDPDLYDGVPPPPPPDPMTPLDFVMREALLLPRPPGALPLAFAHADLRPGGPWRAQMEAAERLVRSQALNPNTLIDLYTSRQPAASGGIWDRVRAIQAFDVALISGDSGAIAETLPAAFEAMREVALEVPFARHYGDRLAGIALSGAGAETAFRVALLSDAYETAVRPFVPATDKERFLKGLATGRIAGLSPPGTLGEAIAEAFLQPPPPGPLLDLLNAGKLGEAILNAMLLLRDEAFADPGDIRAALSAFRAVGLESVARRTAIQLLLLERRG